MDLNLQEIELLITAMAHYEHEGLGESVATTFMAYALKFLHSDDSKSRPYMVEAKLEADQMTERVVLLRAKLIRMKDAATVSEMAEDVCQKL